MSPISSKKKKKKSKKSQRREIEIERQRAWKVVIFGGVHLSLVQICGREEMGIASQEGIRQLQALIDQGLCFTQLPALTFSFFI